MKTFNGVNTAYLTNFQADYIAQSTGILKIKKMQKRSISAFPNPFISSLRIAFYSNEPVSISIVDATGRLIRNLFSGSNPNLVWDGSDNRGKKVASGQFFVVLKEKGAVKSRRIIKK